MKPCDDPRELLVAPFTFFKSSLLKAKAPTSALKVTCASSTDVL